MIDLIGWLATAVFVASYFAPTAALRRIQMAGALLWMLYGVLLGAMPVLVANLLVMLAAAWTAYRSARGAQAESNPSY